MCLAIESRNVSPVATSQCTHCDESKNVLRYKTDVANVTSYILKTKTEHANKERVD